MLGKVKPKRITQTIAHLELQRINNEKWIQKLDY